jgi:hypothetical protein
MSTNVKKYTLTKEHEALIPALVEKWVANAFNTKPLTDDERIDIHVAVKQMYINTNKRDKTANLSENPRVVIAPGCNYGMYVAGWAEAILQGELKKASVCAELASFAAMVNIAVGSEFVTVDKNRHVDRGTPVDARFVPYLHELKRYKETEKFVKFASTEFHSGNAESEEGCYMEFCRDVAKLDSEYGVPADLYETYKPWETLMILSEFRFMTPDFCVVCERPAEFHLTTNPANRLHRDRGPAKVYRDGVELYFLNGVATPAKYVLPDRLDAKVVLAEPNAEIRRELIRKVGIEALLGELKSKTFDTVGDYELLNVDLPEVPNARYLKMKNPSIGVWHVEGVHPNCKTVQEAIDWRAGTVLGANEHWAPSQLT